MDPNEAARTLHLALVYEAYTEEGKERILEAATALRDWLDAGGFEPQWAAYPRARDYMEAFRRER